MEQLEHDNWRGNTGGTTFLRRALTASLRHVPLWLVYLGMAVFFVPFYVVALPKNFRAMYHYFRERRGENALMAYLHTWQNHYRFGQIVVDRFAVYAGKKFRYDLDGNDTFLKLLHGKEGFIVLSSHVGNFELAGYAFKPEGKRYNALVFSGEAEDVMAQRNQMLAAHGIRMIPVSEDMSHIFMMNEALADGEIVSMPADRVFGSPRSVECNFMGSQARFPLGPFAMALQRGVPTIVLLVMKESTHVYKVFVREVKAEDRKFTSRNEKAASLAQSFAHELEEVLKQYPEQWFNYFEFWHQDGE